jgi:flavodoxin
MKKLVIYYSQANGNTKRIAEMISKKTGADIAAIDTVTHFKGYESIVHWCGNHQRKGNPV